MALTVDRYDEALGFYRDGLGLPVVEEWEGGAVLDAGRATLELADPAQAEFIDAVEVGRRVAGHIRIAFEVDDSAEATARLAAAGASVVAEPTRTPWNSLNARLEAPAELQLTFFTELDVR